MLPNTFYKESITLMPNQERAQQNKENYKPIFLINRDTEILKNILANWIQHIKKLTQNDQFGFIPAIQGFTRWKSINVI
jgi:hypothetical protein